MKNETQEILDSLEKLRNELEAVKNFGYSSKNLNFFHALNLSSNELVHSAFLAWLLSPDNVLNSDYKITKKFFSLLYNYVHIICGEIINNKKVRKNSEIINITELDLLNQIPSFGKGYYIETEHVISNRENRIDIFMDFGDTVVIIENKIDTKIHDNQLCRYVYEVNKSKYGKYKNKIFVYLSPKVATDGELPTNIGGDEEYNDEYCTFDYNKIREMLVWILEEARSASVGRDYIKFIKDYKEMLEVEILMNNNDVRAKCKDIRRMYAHELELVMGYNDNIHEVLDYAKQWAIDNGMHIFQPQKTSGEQVSFDFYSDKLKNFYGYGANKKGEIVKSHAGYYHCGTDGGNVLCIWHLAQDAAADKKQILSKNNHPMSYKLVTLLTWDERAKEFVKDANCNCADSHVLCKKTIDEKLNHCLKKIQALEAEL